MPDSNPSQLILAVPGPEQMRSFPKKMIRNAIAKGEIKRSQLIWSPTHNEWKQLRELPHLMPTQQLAPAPVPVRVAIPRQSAPLPASRVVVPDKEQGISIMMILTIILSLIIVGTLGANYYFVDQPFRNNLTIQGQSSLSSHAHFLSFYRPNGILIHLLPSAATTPEKLPNTLAQLAKATPSMPFSTSDYTLVALSSSWFGNYVITGYDWKKFAAMDNASENSRIIFLISSMQDASGKMLYKAPNAPPVLVVDNSAPAPPPAINSSAMTDQAVDLTPEQEAAWKKITSKFAP